ncbi:MAG: 16S rRNA (guanine(966)-N(2))-methyltransferase RsmD [Spirochaeta sp.]|nr:16S rRNA (guanine(966)-N(2))-methyltransferase RsmD [Spirochaeta sp.]
MRITGGKYRGRRLVCPPGEIRPAMDKMRETVFAILGDLAGSNFLDLFAGSGSMAIEAAGRGACQVTLVERDKSKRKVLNRNLELVEEPTQVFFLPVERFVASAREAYDYIFVDAPFPYRHRTDLLGRIAVSRLVGPNSIVMFHYPSEDPMPENAGTLERTDLRIFGRSLVAFYSPCSKETELLL